MRIENIAPINIGSNSEPINNKETTDLPVMQVSGNQVPEQDYITGNEQKQLDDAVKQANKALEGSGRHFKYEVHDATNQVIVSVIDDKTNRVIKEIPPKNLLDMVAKFMELAGLIVDERR